MSLRLLVVDDDPATRLALSETLRLHFADIVVETASAADRALILMATGDFDVVVSDIRMPGMSGMDFLKELKALRPETHVILVTGCELSLRYDALDNGAYAFFQKPIRTEQFLPIIRAALDDADRMRQSVAQSLERHIDTPARQSGL
jgi:DNA-binding NtrC family response regulator